MRWEHPIVTLDVGALSANVKRAIENDELVKETLTHLRRAVCAAGNIKKECQLHIGRFIESVFTQPTFKVSDRKLLDGICPRISMAEGNEDEVGEDAEAGNGGDISVSSLRSLMIYLYSGNTPKGLVEKFVTRAQTFGLLKVSRDRSELNRTMEFTPSSLLPSMGSQLSAKVKRMYRKGKLGDSRFTK
ncbi:hypothetical protein BGX27_008758, partial [Mortierella sp. AM989]